MPQARAAVAATATVLATMLAAALSGCGGSSSSANSPPSAASKADFCRTFDGLGTGTTPRDAADALSRVGTPSDMSPSARHGFEVLVDHLRALPPKTQARKITQMVQGLSGGDMSDLRALIAYYGSECRGLPGDPSS